MTPAFTATDIEQAVTEHYERQRAPKRVCGLCGNDLGPTGTWCGCFWADMAQTIYDGLRVPRRAP